MKKLKRTLACLLAVVLLAGMFALPASAVGFTPNFEISAPAAYIVNTDTNIIVYEKDSETQYQAASLTKLMTAILLLEEYGDDLDNTTATVSNAVQDYVYIHGGSNADIRAGESRTLRQMLYAMMLPSANEAAYIVADYMGGGSIDNFVAMMNEEAARIGCTGTTFADPCGLDTNNVTTARDAYLILRALTSYDIFATVVSTPSYDMGTNDRYTTPGTYVIQNTDKMLNEGSAYYRSYVRGGKTGSLGEWQNFAGWHTQDGISYISVVLNVPYEADPDQARPALYETAQLMDVIFGSFTIAAALDPTQPITEIPVDYATQSDTVMLYPTDNMMTLLPKEGGAALTEQTFNLPKSIAAPVRQGDVVGTVTLTIEGEVIGTTDLIAGSDVARNQVLYTIARVGEFFSSTYFKVVVMLTMIVVAVYAFLFVLAALGVLKPIEKSSKKRTNK